MLKTPIMSVAFSVAEEARRIPNGITPFNKEIERIRDVVYKTVDGKELVMDLYPPKKPVGEKTPVVYIIPGGGWMIHNRNRRDGYARLFATMGAFVCVIDHRLTTDIKFPENLIDCIDGLNFLETIKDEYNLDLENVTVTGDSSGGHLTACVGCASSSKEYCEKLGLPEVKVKAKYLIGISGAYSFETMYRIPFTHTLMVRYFCGQNTRKGFRNWKYYKESIPYNYINKDYPEMYNNGGMTDMLCLGEAKRMAEHLDKAGIKNEYYVRKSLYNAFHCYVYRLPFASSRRDMLKLLTWYNERQNEYGVDMSQGFGRVKTFLENYTQTLSGHKEC